MHAITACIVLFLIFTSLHQYACSVGFTHMQQPSPLSKLYPKKDSTKNPNKYTSPKALPLPTTVPSHPHHPDTPPPNHPAHHTQQTLKTLA
mmetsp:Transcript_27815/g.40304  ORF Transcript_27815/g.40304 Transcript_27815/m.40304 type:complete len:91 (-) Transcript_27815:1162-1434(-)